MWVCVCLCERVQIRSEGSYYLLRTWQAHQNAGQKRHKIRSCKWFHRIRFVSRLIQSFKGANFNWYLNNKAAHMIFFKLTSTLHTLYHLHRQRVATKCPTLYKDFDKAISCYVREFDSPLQQYFSSKLVINRWEIQQISAKCVCFSRLLHKIPFIVFKMHFPTFISNSHHQ